jgi:hypothetical protein
MGCGRARRQGEGTGGEATKSREQTVTLAIPLNGKSPTFLCLSIRPYLLARLMIAPSRLFRLFYFL